jgi:UPF0271 protein
MIADRVVAMITTNQVTAIDGARVPIDAKSICVHCDTPDAVRIARTVGARLEDVGVELMAFT